MENLAKTEVDNGRKSLSKKLIRVDMTPMVDLGFLLITFFMLSTNFSKPNVVDLGLPAGEGGTEINYKNQLTFVLGKDNRVFYYQKELKDLSVKDWKEISLEKLNISNLITSFKKEAPNAENFTVIIKPTDDSNYKNFVDMLDEMTLAQNERYGISNLKKEEEKLYTQITK